MKEYTVLAKPGCTCPRQNPREEKINDHDPNQRVPATSFYDRLIADGSLILQPEIEAPEVEKSTVKSGGKK